MPKAPLLWAAGTAGPASWPSRGAGQLDCSTVRNPRIEPDPSTAAAFEAAGSTQHARMPYWEVPEPIAEDGEQLLEWAATAAEVAARGRR